MSSDDCDEFIQNKLIRTRGKCTIYARQTDVRVEVKMKASANRRTASASASASPAAGGGSALPMSHDIWFHIAMHIDPEDVQSFGMICKETARLVNSRAFWLNLYNRYCLGPDGGWNLNLPEKLQVEHTRNCDTRALKAIVVPALFYCHPLFKLRLELGYKLDWLLNCFFISMWQRTYRGLWVVCYKLWNGLQPESSLQEESLLQEPSEVVNDWESLADDKALQPAIVKGNPHEGAMLLIVICNRFVPAPHHLAYSHQQKRYRLRATRELLSTDMRATNLEIDFAADGAQNETVTVKYARIAKYKVLPWWHPDFPKFVK
ncbi:hypothetical protein KR018_004112 [Drosophila ironensis]|nr:hypothetical protein KR018_004112 [Drosophila ironensis]